MSDHNEQRLQWRQRGGDHGAYLEGLSAWETSLNFKGLRHRLWLLLSARAHNYSFFLLQFNPNANPAPPQTKMMSGNAIAPT
jgi:hypothetical protein